MQPNETVANSGSARHGVTSVIIVENGGCSYCSAFIEGSKLIIVMAG